MDEYATLVYNQVRQELFVAKNTTPKSSEILKKLDAMIQGLSPLKDLVVRMENIELLTEQATKRAMMSTLPDPREAVPWKRRKVISMPRIMEEEPVLDIEQR